MKIGLAVLFEAFWKSGVLLGAALCLTFFLRRKSADLRRLVLSAAIVAILAAAAALPFLPRWTAEEPAWFHPPTVPAAAHVSIDHGPVLTLPESKPVPTGLPSSRPAPPTPIRIPETIPLIWVTGTVILLARLVISLLSLRRLRRHSIAVTCPDFSTDRVALLQNEMIEAPVTWGTMRAVILVPPRFESLPAESRRAVLCHEAAHIEAYDFLFRLLAEIASALIWFQPLMWMAFRRLRIEQELASDDRVLAAGEKPSAYAKLLLEWDRYLDGHGSPIAVGMVQRSSLKRRLHSLLDENVERTTVSRTGSAAAWFLTLAVALPLAALGFIPATPALQSTHAEVAAPLLRLPTVPIQLAQARVPEPSPAVKPKSPGAVVVLILDKSASMEGAKIALLRTAANVVIDSLPPGDEIGILTFNHEMEWTVPIRRADDKAAMKNLIAGIYNDGGTKIAPALREAYDKILPYDASYRHILLLTDGISEESDSETLAKDAATHKITISTIGLGEDIRRPFLEKIATAAAGNSYFLSAPAGLDDVMLQDVRVHTGAAKPNNR